MPVKFGKGMKIGYIVKFGKSGTIKRWYATLEFAFKRAYNESGSHAAYVSHRGRIVAVFQRGGVAL
jgi:hypothetical protein